LTPCAAISLYQGIRKYFISPLIALRPQKRKTIPNENNNAMDNTLKNRENLEGITALFLPYLI
jgi:hypothetical protein